MGSKVGLTWEGKDGSHGPGIHSSFFNQFVTYKQIYTHIPLYFNSKDICVVGEIEFQAKLSLIFAWNSISPTTYTRVVK